jgi:hypothetical protein
MLLENGMPPLLGKSLSSLSEPICERWLGILNTFRTKYYYDILDLSPKIKSLNSSFGLAS